MSEKDRQCSSSSSSGSSCGGGFFSESFAIKPVRTGKSEFDKDKLRNCDDSGINWRVFSHRSEHKSDRESRLVKTKSKALKIYADLKRVKQPISPGGKVTAFLNSLFSAGNFKKPKFPTDSPSLKSTSTTCSSFSRSCHSTSTTPSSAKSAAVAKQSIRFYPESVILDDDCRRKPLLNDDIDSILAAFDEELAMHVKKKDLIFGCEFDEEDDEFDGASCTSSDLFELENLSAIGMQELPVYETTHL